MTSDHLISVFGIVGALVGVVIGALLNHFLENNRNKNSLMLEKKIEVYSNILVKLNTVFQDEKINLGLDALSKYEIQMKVSKTLTEGRLLAGKELEEKLRDYHDVAMSFWENTSKEPYSNMSKLVMEIEQLMRIEVGQKKLY